MCTLNTANSLNISFIVNFEYFWLHQENSLVDKYTFLNMLGMIQSRAWKAWRKSGNLKQMHVRDEGERAESHPESVSTCLPVIDLSTKWPAIRFRV